MTRGKMKKILSLCLTAIMVLAFVAPLAACSNAQAESPDTGSSGTITENRTPTSAAPSGEIVVYTALEDELVTEYLTDFEAKYPDIKVNVVRESTGIITAKLLAEKDNPVADVVWGTAASSMMVLDEQDMLEPYAPTGADKILPEFKSDKSVPTWVGIDAWETAFIVNTVEIEKLGLSASDIKSYEDLLRPELKGHIVMSNPSSSGTGLLTVTGVLQLNGKDSDEGWNYLDALHENVDQYVHSGSAPAKMAAAGECVIGVSFGYAGISAQQDGSPVEVVFPSDGSGWDLEANALLKKDEVNPAAQTFLDWAISDSAMDMYKENYPIICNGQGGKYEGFDSDPVDQLIENDFVWIAANREDILNTWTEKYDGKSAAQ